MPKWDGIEDPRAKAELIWLSKKSSTKKSTTATNNEGGGGSECPWKPLRKVDCIALNKFMDEQKSSSTKKEQRHQHVYIDGGRETAYPNEGIIKYNFLPDVPTKQLTSALWFVKEEKTENNNNASGDSNSGGDHHVVSFDDGNKDNKQKNFILNPMSIVDSNIVEELYQRAINQLSSLAGDKNDIEQLLKEKYVLSDDSDYAVSVTKTNNNNTFSIRKKPKNASWLSFGGPSYELQRGYGPYKIEGEEEEELLGPVNHIVFVIHGIGEAMWSRDNVKQSSIVDETTRTRINIQRMQIDQWKKQCNIIKKNAANAAASAKKDKDDEEALSSFLPPKPPNRIEFIPIQWYDRIHSTDNEFIQSLNMTTLKSIPALRSIANDVILDVLLYLKPKFCYDVIDCVTKQINDLYNKVQLIHSKSFSSVGDGKWSLIGHSLGSVIAWDILCLKKEQDQQQQQQDEQNAIIIKNDKSKKKKMNASSSSSSSSMSLGVVGDEVNHHLWGPTLSKPLGHCALPFTPEFTLFLGSPVGLFLTLRGAHSAFDEMRQQFINEKEQEDERKRKEQSVLTNNGCSVANILMNPPPSSFTTKQKEEDRTISSVSSTVTIPSPFTLPSKSIYNIFHPSDPVAYRIEPLLLSQPSDFSIEDCLPPPVYLVNKGQGVRLHIKAMQLGDEIRKSFYESTTNFNSFISTVTEQATNVLDTFSTNQAASIAAAEAATATIAAAAKTTSNSDNNDEKTTSTAIITKADSSSNNNIKARTATATTKKKSKNVIRLELEKVQYPLGGKTSRIDYMLQTGVIDNEYISAVTAHSSYFTRTDILELVIDLAAAASV